VDPVGTVQGPVQALVNMEINLRVLAPRS
jgi:hypothetical protein